MTKSQIIDRMLDPGIVAVIRVDSGATLLPICDALLSGGTVLDSETCRAAILAGAQFVVTPVCRPEIVAMCLRYGKAGCAALGAGSSLVAKEFVKNQDWAGLTARGGVRGGGEQGAGEVDRWRIELSTV